MRSNTPLARTLALGASAAVIVVAAGTAATAAPRGVGKLTAALRISSAAPLAGNPVQVDVHGDALTGTGKMVVKQTDFGIEPVSAGGGLVKVEDGVTVTFRIVARAAAP